MGLSAKHKATIRTLAKAEGKVELYEGDSLTGYSWTLRYSHTYHDRYYGRLRTKTGHILSVVIPMDKSKVDEAYKKYCQLVKEAKAYFKSLRGKR